MRQHALRAGQVVDVLARGDHLVGRQRVLVPVAAGHAADDRHHRVAVAEDFLDVVGAVELLERSPRASWRRAAACGRTLDRGGRRGVSSYHLRLTSTWCVCTSKMNWSLGHFSSKALRVVDLGGVDVVAVAEDLVEGQQRGGHAAAGAEEVAAGQALPAARRRSLMAASAGLVLLLLRATAAAG